MRVRVIVPVVVAAVVGGVLALPAAHAGPVQTAAQALPVVPRPLCGQAGHPAVPRPAGPSAPARPAGTLRVATYNMLHGLTADGDRTLEARLVIAADELATSGVDIVGVQEAEESTKHGLVIDRLATALGQRTGSNWYWCWFRTEPHWPGAPDTRRGGGDPLSTQLAKHYNSNEDKWFEGAAVLSRWPITESAVHRLPGEDLRERLLTDCAPPFRDPACLADLVLEPRAAVWARVTSPYGPLSFTSTHTSGTPAQHRDLVRWVGQRSAKDAAALLVCDCNSVANSRAQSVIRGGGWVDTAALVHRAGPTSDQDISAAAPTVTARIDYVFLRAGTPATVVSSKRFMNVPRRQGAGWLWPSDHYGVIDTLALQL